MERGHPPEAKEDAANRLALESSPYLLQHAHNPVDWFPWGEEAFALARDTDRPVLLSIGYSACHWCHVMERESFEDPDTARVMNELFVSVKVDREERPDIDHVYMQAVQMLTGRGGWPLTAFLKPDGEPYFGGTYFPPEPRHGMPAFKEVLEAASRAYHERRDDVDRTAAELRGLIGRASSRRPDPAQEDANPIEASLDRAVRRLVSAHDPTHGGFGGAPKFPQPLAIELLLAHYQSAAWMPALSAAVHTLRSMARGGMRDHLGGGFHRYSVDARWLVPHFEKMLYDNGLLARAYTRAHQVTGSPDLARVAETTLDYVLGDLQAPEGGFFSARDADSEGEEGTYYLWDADQVDHLLGDDAALFRRVYDVSGSGNFEGRNILHLPHDLEAIARSEELSVEALEARLVGARAILLRARSERVPPFLDDKVLTSWTAYTISALAVAAHPLSRPDYVTAARGAAEFLCGPASPDGALKHTFREGVAKVPALLQDVAALGNALLDLYGVDPDVRWLDRAAALAEQIRARFLDEESGLVYDTPSGGEALIVRPRDLHDGAEPSGNALAAELLLRVGALYGREDLTNLGRTILASVPDPGRNPLAFAKTLTVALEWSEGPLEVVLTGDRTSQEWQALHREVTKRYLSGLVFLAHDGSTQDGTGASPTERHPLLLGKTTVNGQPTAYVCWHHTCSPPVTDPGALGQLLDQANRGSPAASGPT